VIRRFLFPLPLLFVLGLAGTMTSTAREEIAPERVQQIAEVEKQLADLQKKLAELKGAAPATGKKPLALVDADTWRAVRGAALSPNGQWFAARIAPGEGEGEVILRSTHNEKETKYPAGGGFGALAFSDDGKWFAFSSTPVPPRRAGGRGKGKGKGKGPGKAEEAKASDEKRTPPKVVLVNLATQQKTELEGISSFTFSGEGCTHLALRKANVDADAPATAPTGGPPRPAIPFPGPVTPTMERTGSDLIVRELATGDELTLGNVSEFAFDKKGQWLALVIDATGQIGNGVQLRDMKSGVLFPIDTGKARYSHLAWTDKGDALVVLKSVEDKDREGKVHTILGFKNVGPKPEKIVYDWRNDKAFPAGMGISSNQSPAWTEDRERLVFGIAEQKKEKKEEKKEEPKKDETAKGPSASGESSTKPDLVIWHWKDDRLQPMQKVQASRDKAFTYSCVYNLEDKKFVRLADDTLRTATPVARQRYALGTDSTKYQYTANLDGKRFSDVYAIDLTTGERKPILSKTRWVLGTSPTGEDLLYFDRGHYFAYHFATGAHVNLTARVSMSFVNAEDDHPVENPPIPPVGWTANGRYVLLSDNWDIWQVAADGSGGVNLTVNGRKDGIRYRRLFQYIPDAKGLDLAQPLYTTLYGEWTKKSGFGRIDPGKPGVTPLLWEDAGHSFQPLKAKRAEVFVYTRETNQEAPDYYCTDGTFKNPKRLTTTNPQQANHHWSSGAKLIDYKGVEGQRLQAALFLPANHEPGKKYPTIVYIYERLSNGLHRYTPPGTAGFNKAIYTSNGYAVLMPDIRYRINDPGRSAVECVLPALDAAIADGVVDPAKVGLHGHSWGGYQTAFLITQTDRFKAAIAGAPLTNLVSMYSSVYWNTGSANQPIFESSQGRFTAGYWQLQDAYLRNSPVFHASKVKTPLLLLHNDKDGAVDWTQGIEYFNTLRRLEKPVVMLQYVGENHGLSKPENRKDYAIRMKEFFDHHLMGKPAPDWWKDGVPHLKLDDHLEGRKKLEER
jgi:dipeptidyl aminopeptidase/acylaminoacyl peptidase